MLGQTIEAQKVLGIGNGGGKQGCDNQPPYRRYGPDTEIQYRPRKRHGLAKPIRILSKRAADAPHVVDTDTIADAVSADAISETSKVDETPTEVPRQNLPLITEYLLNS